MKHPIEVQEELFYYLIEEAGATRFGFDHNFQQIKNINDFKENVPIRTYEQFRPYIDKIKDGEEQVTWPSKVKWFAKSSGTTDNNSKYIPVTQESLDECHYKGGKDLLSIYYHIQPTAKLYNGKTLVVGGSSKIVHDHQGKLTGDLSAIIIDNLPSWVENKRTPSKEIALMDNWEEKLEAMAEATMNENVTNIAGVPSWTLLLLQKICAKKGVASIHDAWPNFELYMHGGISFLPYKSQFEALFSQPVHFMETYNASEGFFGIQDRKDADDMLLMLDYGIFYEFIPMDQLQQEHPQTLGLGEVEIGPSYAVVISTNGGLWRYLIGDTIRFTSIQPFRIKITGRTKQYINIAGEELMVENAEQALHQTCTKHQCSINDYTVGPIMESGEQIAHHHWIIEFNTPPQDLALFEMDLDLELRKTNSDYDAKRKGNLNLNPLHIMPVDQLTFLNWMKQRGKLGGQNKVPRLHPNPQYIHELQRFIQPL
ncbi:MAG: hypothetical protein RL521_52 [Bacteroidota bacterium]